MPPPAARPGFGALIVPFGGEDQRRRPPSCRGPPPAARRSDRRRHRGPSPPGNAWRRSSSARRRSRPSASRWRSRPPASGPASRPGRGRPVGTARGRPDLQPRHALGRGRRRPAGQDLVRRVQPQRDQRLAAAFLRRRVRVRRRSPRRARRRRRARQLARQGQRNAGPGAARQADGALRRPVEHAGVSVDPACALLSAVGNTRRDRAFRLFRREGLEGAGAIGMVRGSMKSADLVSPSCAAAAKSPAVRSAVNPAAPVAARRRGS